MAIERIEKQEKDLSLYCVIDDVHYYDGELKNVNYNFWRTLNKEERKSFREEFAKKYKVSKKGDVLIVGGRKNPSSKEATNIDGDQFSYKVVSWGGASISVSIGITTTIQRKRLIAYTFLASDGQFYEVDRINPESNFKNKRDSIELSNLQFLTPEEHNEKTSVDISNQSSKVNIQRDRDLTLLSNVAKELLRGQTAMSKNLSIEDKINCLDFHEKTIRNQYINV